ncbi:MAG: hypothetical protein EOP45_09640 [Sphingobacteriaceae bacterium]|nr:MAG: hypothetical protein EOP45_09640 [Sphingobacteriaceae bacterium]
MHLYGLLVSWHLLNQRASPASLEGKEYSVDSSRKFLGVRCRALLRGKQVEVAVEKWNLFILPRFFEKVSKNVDETLPKTFLNSKALRSSPVNRDKSLANQSTGKSLNATAFPQLSINSLRKDREYVRSFYVSSALYKSKSVSIIKSSKSEFSLPKQSFGTPALSENQSSYISASVSESKNGSSITRKEEVYRKSPDARERVSLQSQLLYKLLKKESLVKSTFLPFPSTSSVHYYTEQVVCNSNQNLFNLFSDARLRKRKVVAHKVDLLSNSRNFSSYLGCPNLLFVPEMQDCAQSGVLLEGSVILDLCVR